ncbi:MAG: hypothetical protein M5U31_02580 [Acidimicrobiia bacterium]|nr:hypothetical protein [Acidimicrobiia bacterium]
MDKINEIKLGEKIIGVSGILLFLDSFLSWYSVDFGFGSYTRNGWQAPSSFLSILAILIGIAMVTLVILSNLTDVELPETLGPLTHPQLYTIGGGLAFVLVLIKWIGNTDYTAFGLYIGLLCTAGLAAGGFMVMQGVGESGDAGSGGSTPPPPPPSA